MRTALAVAAALLLSAAPALAHAPSRRLGDFWGGFLHPLVSLEHALPLLALALWAGLTGRAESRRVLVAAPAGIAIGTALAAAFPPPDGVALANRLSFVLLGMLAAGALRLPAPVMTTVAGLLAIGHGWENAAGLTGSRVEVFGAGAVAAVCFLVTVPAAGVVLLPAAWPRIAVRVVGSWIAAAGALSLALR